VDGYVLARITKISRTPAVQESVFEKRMYKSEKNMQALNHERTFTTTGSNQTSKPMESTLSCLFGGLWGGVNVVFTAQIMDAENGILRRDMRSKWYRVGSLRGPSVLCGTESRCARDRTSSGSIISSPLSGSSLPSHEDGNSPYSTTDIMCQLL